MFLMSQGMKHLGSAKHEKVTAQSKKILWILSGTMPTKAQLDALLQTNGTILSNGLKGLGTLRLSAAYPATTVVQDLNASLKKWALEAADATFTIHSPGPANWFVFMYAQTAINEPTYSSSVPVYQAFIGTVGDLDSGSDIEMLSGNIESDKVYKIADLEIRTL